MKGCLALLSLLLVSCAASAQIPDSATGRRRLDRDRLWGIKFGTFVSHYNRQKDREKWNRYPEQHKLGPYELEYPHYHFSDDLKKS